MPSSASPRPVVSSVSPSGTISAPVLASQEPPPCRTSPTSSAVAASQPNPRPAPGFAPLTIHSTNPLERLNKEVKRRADVVGIFPNQGAIIRLIGAVLLEANDEWQLQNRYMQTEPMTELMTPAIDAVPTQIATMAA